MLFFERLDDALGIGLLLALQLNHLSWGTGHELFVGEFLQDTLQETFLVLQLGLHAYNLCLHVDKVASQSII